jgi:hypothetical protein
MAWMRLRTCILHARDLLKKADPVLELKKKTFWIGYLMEKVRKSTEKF